MCSKLNSDLIMLVKLVLLLPSSKMGTFLLCGKASLCWKKKKTLPGCGQDYPIYCYARAFPYIPPQERERERRYCWKLGPIAQNRPSESSSMLSRYHLIQLLHQGKAKKENLKKLKRKRKTKTKKQIKAKRLKSSKFKTKKTLNHFVGFFFFNL